MTEETEGVPVKVLPPDEAEEQQYMSSRSKAGRGATPTQNRGGWAAELKRKERRKAARIKRRARAKAFKARHEKKERTRKKEART
jgi:hypothetical protein